ncbi:hypothetical protein ETAA8_24340 [Anatilimnocola aggregata]|uniref:Uncharacterized protein n=1 Tax=Anatilimnocola aggregata TaxID=2528021 RepID=A0A517YAT6_9BACT|nr:hypothetical protein [Anatilimnocola aggregata]QDU27347.1 hypothetical protein ETAA8_24340 [Anatilimnocola aggregata]
MFIRFVAAAETDDPWWADGVITAACSLLDDGTLESYQAEVVNDSFAWFNRCLPCPPFHAGSWSRSAVCWFRPTAKEPIARMWDLVAVLKDHDLRVRVIRTEFPGRIVYQDPFQIVAETPRPSGIRRRHQPRKLAQC